MANTFSNWMYKGNRSNQFEEEPFNEINLLHAKTGF